MIRGETFLFLGCRIIFKRLLADYEFSDSSPTAESVLASKDEKKKTFNRENRFSAKKQTQLNEIKFVEKFFVLPPHPIRTQTARKSVKIDFREESWHRPRAVHERLFSTERSFIPAFS